MGCFKSTVLRFTNFLECVGARLAPACSRFSYDYSFSARLFGPLAFSGFGQRSLPVLLADFTLYPGLLGARKIAERTREQR